MAKTLKLALLLVAIGLTACSHQKSGIAGMPQPVDYSMEENWYERTEAFADTSFTKADVFYLYPTISLKSYEENNHSWNLALPLAIDEKANINNNQRFNKMLYADYAFYAPYYRQLVFSAYMQSDEVKAQPFNLAATDVKAAFREYMEKYNHGRPFFLVGHSQGSQMLLELLKEGMTDEAFDCMVAAYLIGYGVTKEELAAYPNRIRPAEGATDYGKVVVFNSVTRLDAYSPLLPPSAVGINPLTWTVDSVLADKQLHKGLAKYNEDRSAILFDAHLTGGSLQDHVMVCSDLPDDYCFQQSLSWGFPLGNLHFVDSFLYGKDVVENMKARLESFRASR